MGRAPSKNKPDAKPKQVVLLVHGIRTQAAWTEMVKKLLEETGEFEVQPIKYGFLDTFRFLFPFFTRKAPIRRFVREYRDTKLLKPGASISVVAHSFGTYIVAKALEQETDIVFDKVVLCGSIVPDDFRVAPHRAQLGADPILNDCGTHDVWPVLAKSATWGYGATGTFGFGSNGIRDRFHKFTHSAYFDETFVKEFWLPYFKQGHITPTLWEMQRPNPPYWQSLLSIAPLRWLLPLLLAGYLVWPTIGDYSSVPVARFDRQLFYGHWIGAPQIFIRLHFSNKNFSENQIFVERALLTSPDGGKIPIFVERINNCNGMVPINVFIVLPAYGSAVCDYELIGDMAKLGKLSVQVDQAIRANNAMTLLPDPNRSLLTGDVLGELEAAARTGLMWKPGSWSVSVEYGTGKAGGGIQNKTHIDGTFNVSAGDLAYFENAVSSYASGIGVFAFWRNLEPNRLLPAEISSPEM